MNRAVRLAALAAILVPLSVAFGDQTTDLLAPYSGRIIKKIEIVRRNIFDEELKHHPPFFYRWANALHIMTRTRVIERELLFAVGDTLDPERIIETERNLRAGQFIGEIVVTASEDGPDGVDLTVTTQDLWTTRAEIRGEFTGGRYEIGFAATEGNFLGWGKYLQLSGLTSSDQKGYEILYSDSRLAGSRLNLNLDAAKYTFNDRYQLSLGRPQYSLTVPFSFNFNFALQKSRFRLFDRNHEYFRYRGDLTSFQADGKYSFGQATKLDLFASYDYENDNYSTIITGSPLNVLVPPDEVISIPLIGSGAQVISYGSRRFIDDPGTPEDFAFGAGIKFVAGYSSKAFGANYIGWHQTASAQFLLNPTEPLYVGASDALSWWRHNGALDRIHHVTEAAVYFKPSKMQVIALHGLTDFAWKQRSGYQVVLGGSNGLRGFPTYEFSGNRLAMANAEYRFFLPITILTVRLGGALFVDCGNVWKDFERIHPRQLRSDAGFGIRLGLTKSSTARVLRLDFARSLNDKRAFVNFSSGMIFNLNFASISE